VVHRGDTGHLAGGGEVRLGLDRSSAELDHAVEPWRADEDPTVRHVIDDDQLTSSYGCAVRRAVLSDAGEVRQERLVEPVVRADH
jgi:hypothetical protein